VNTNAVQNRVQETLLRALEQDRQQFLHYLDSLLKAAESRIDAMPGLTPMSPVRDRRDGNEQGGLQTPKPGDNVGIHGVLSADVAVKNEKPLPGDVDYNSDAFSGVNVADKVAPDEPSLMKNSKLHPPSSTQGNTVRSIPKDMKSLRTGEHDEIEIVQRLILCCQL